MKPINLFMFGLLSLVLVACKTTETADAKYAWPSFQNGLKPGTSTSPVKAKLPGNIEFTPALPGTPEVNAAYGGIWEGWMCPSMVVDVKVAVTNVTKTGATVAYASGAESFGKFSQLVSASFKSDTLQGRFTNGVNLILGMRSDGHLNIKYDSSSPCSGVLHKSSRQHASSSEPTAANSLSATVPLPGNLKIQPPANNVSAEVASFVGKWAGMTANGRNIVVVIESVDSNGTAKVVYALSENKKFRAFYVRSEGSIKDGLLTFFIRGGAKLEYRIVDVDRMAGTWSRGGQSSDMILKKIS